MSKIKLTGDSSGYVEISAPNAAGNNTLELPASGSKIVVSDGSDNINVAGIVTASGFVGNLTGTASTATAAATAYGLSGSPTLSGITSVSTTNLTVNGNAYPTAGPLSNRNLIINGAMQVAQWGTQSTSVTTGGYYTVDRFKYEIGSLGTWTLDQSTDAPDGFSNSFKLTCTTADASPASSDYSIVSQSIEAQNLQHLEYGSSSAKPLTLSFYVKSNKTGNASLEIFQEDNSSKLYSVQYTINSADTWEKKTITIPGDTSGVINNDNGAGLRFGWWLNSGSNYTGGSFGGWKTYDATSRNVSNLGVGGAISDYFAITGVQLEVGERATPFEYRSYGEELALCQRYFVYITTAGSTRFAAGYASNSSFSYCPYTLPCMMRSTPTFARSAPATFSVAYKGTARVCSNITVGFLPDNRSLAFGCTSSSLTAGEAVAFNANGAGFMSFDAEL